MSGPHAARDREDGPQPPAPDDVIDLRDWELRTARLAELVSGITGCEPGGALHAVRRGDRGAVGTPDVDPLVTVARAVVDVESPLPPRFRAAGYLRGDVPVHRALFRAAGYLRGDVPVHRALRRWERSVP